jgi:hypothetical protein
MFLPSREQSIGAILLRDKNPSQGSYHFLFSYAVRAVVQAAITPHPTVRDNQACLIFLRAKSLQRGFIGRNIQAPLE